MSLLQLPEEVLLMILQQLDLPTLHSLYNTCSCIRNIVIMQGVIKGCCMSMNTMATVKSLKSPFFSDIAAHIQELNLSGAPDIRKTYVVRALKRCKNLQSLDISFTNLNLLDFNDIFKVCPTITNIACNFMISRSGLTRLTEEAISQCQRAFKHMRNIHFVGSATNLLYSKVALLLLQDCDIDTLNYTVAESDRLHTIYVPQSAESADMVRFKQFFLCFLDWTTIYAFFGSFFMLPVLSIINIDAIEAIIIIKQDLKQYCIHATTLFKKYFRDTFGVEADKIYITEYRDAIIGNAVIMIWDKECNTFDDAFFTNLTELLKPYFPCNCQPYMNETVPPQYDWYFMNPRVPDELPKKTSGPKRRRLAPSHYTLDYDDIFQNKTKLQLSLVFDKVLKHPLTISPQSTYLSKLTYLSISGPVKFSTNFYPTLFKSCVNLVTANIESSPLSPCINGISRGIVHARKLKNLRMLDRGVNFPNVYTALAKCKSLENVFIVEESSTLDVDVGDPTKLFEGCPHLYCLFVEGPITEQYKNKKLQKWHDLRSKHNKHHVHLMIHARSDINKIFYSYDPFVSVFNLNPIKQISLF